MIRIIVIITEYNHRRAFSMRLPMAPSPVEARPPALFSFSLRRSPGGTVSVAEKTNDWRSVTRGAAPACSAAQRAQMRLSAHKWAQMRTNAL